MKNNLLNLIISIAFIGVLSSQIAFAEEQSTATQSQEVQNSDSKTPVNDTKSSEEKGEMTGSCSHQHKDGKMCEHHTMEECNKNKEHKNCNKKIKK